MGAEYACLASGLAGTLVDGYASGDQSITTLAAWPAFLLAQLVQVLAPRC